MNRTELRNKLMLGALTISDLRKLVRIEGLYTLGKNWLPIQKTRVKKGELQIFMEQHSSDPEISMPLDSVIKEIDGKIVRMQLDSLHVSCGYLVGDTLEIKIMLEEAPFP